MTTRIIKTEEAFMEDCVCAFKVFGFVETMESDAKWCFDVAYFDPTDHSYRIIFKPYMMEACKDYMVSVNAIKNNDTWDLSLIQKIDHLV